jgi:hypothetical protein
MKKEDYLKLRNNNNQAQICYNYYQEKVAEKGLKKYDGNTFIQAFNIWQSMHGSILETVLSHYDNKFTITTLSLENREIKYY